MNKKMIRTGIFSLTALLTLAAATPIAVSAYGYGSQNTMESRESGHHMNNYSWAEGESQEWRGSNDFMNRGEERSWDRQNMHTDDYSSQGSCRANSMNGVHRNSRMMRSEGWSEAMVNHHSFNGSNIEDNR